MSNWLKVNTAAVISFGPFVSPTDAVTLVTSLVSALDHASTGILLAKNGGALTIRHATVTASTYDAYGNYQVTLDATDMNTLGRLRVQFTAAASCLPVWRDYEVVAANIYDSFVGGGDVLDVSVTQLLGTAWLTPAVAGTPDVNTKTLTAGAITATAIASDAITDAKVASDVTIASVTGAVGSVTGAVGSVTGSVGSVASGGITSASFAANSITAAAIANGAIDAATFAANALDAVWATAARTLTAFGFGVTVTTNSDKTGYTLSAAGVQGIWDALTSVLTTAGSIGKLLVDNINATISSRLASAGYTAPLDATGTENAVWNATTASHLTAGSTGNALNAAGSAGDPWATALPGAYGAGSAGLIVGNNLNAPIGDVPTADENAAALLDLTDGIETGLTLRQALRLIAAADAGKLSGATDAVSNTILIRNAKADSKVRITAQTDQYGNRSVMVTDVS